jgi:fructose/tagatose bisphosphate aldolase
MPKEPKYQNFKESEMIEKNPEGENDVVFTYGRNIRYHSAKYIVKMVKHLHEKYQIDFQLQIHLDHCFVSQHNY